MDYTVNNQIGCKIKKSKNNDENCFKYVNIASVHCDKVNNNPERISYNKTFANQHNWKKKLKDWESLFLLITLLKM